MRRPGKHTKRIEDTLQKICFKLAETDPIDCETENYLPWNESQYLIQDYGIQAIPVIIQGNKTRTGMMYWDLEKERNDLITQLHVSCQNGVCV